MILNVRKSNFIIYVSCLVAGILLIAGAIIAYCVNKETIADELLLSIGCSTIPTVVTAYLIDQASEKRNAAKTRELRDHFLWGMPHGLLWIMKTIIEFYPTGDGSKPFYDSFKDSVSFMKNKEFDDEHFLEQGKEIAKLLNNSYLGYGIGLCLRNCKAIIDHNYELEINSVFTKYELLTIADLYEECERIQKVYRLCEMAEYIRVFVDAVIEWIPEIAERTKRTAIIENERIKNWADISK